MKTKLNKGYYVLIGIAGAGAIWLLLLWNYVNDKGEIHNVTVIRNENFPNIKGLQIGCVFELDGKERAIIPCAYPPGSNIQVRQVNYLRTPWEIVGQWDPQ